MHTASYKAIAYYRVSSGRQARSGLGLEAQRECVESFCKANGLWLIAPAFTEVESGKRNDRAELMKAIQRCRQTDAVLVISKLDRLSRNAAFLLTLRDGGVRFLACDMPDANEFTVGIMALVAEQERKAISTRTREALAVAKARGTKLGNPLGVKAFKGRNGSRAGAAAIKRKADEHAELMRPVVDRFQREGFLSLNGLARALNEHEKTMLGGRWYATSVRNLLTRLNRLGAEKSLIRD